MGLTGGDVKETDGAMHAEVTAATERLSAASEARASRSVRCNFLLAQQRPVQHGHLSLPCSIAALETIWFVASASFVKAHSGQAPSLPQLARCAGGMGCLLPQRAATPGGNREGSG